MASSSSAAAAAVTSQFIFIDGVNLFYRSAGPTNAPVVLALHTSPASSFSFRSLLSELGDSYRILAPDLPGSGFTEVGDARRYEYSFDSLSRTLEAFVDALNIKKLSLLVHGSGGPVGFRYVDCGSRRRLLHARAGTDGSRAFGPRHPSAVRLALRRPELIHTVITCNAPISLDGLGPFWEESGLRSLWAEPTAAQYKSLQAKILTYEAIKLQVRCSAVKPWGRQAGSF
jgi:pimeloyl-ACP methyl ester carboxylesterase